MIADVFVHDTYFVINVSPVEIVVAVALIAIVAMVVVFGLFGRPEKRA